MSTSFSSKFMIGATVAIVLSIIGGVIALGSPTQERARRLDDRRVADLRGIADATDLYWTRHEALPASLADLAAEPGVQIRTVDPVTSETYAYEPSDSTAYELCATFDQASRDVARGRRGELWRHGPGHHCFALEAEEIERNER